MRSTTAPGDAGSNKPLRFGLWLGQALLAFMFANTGYMKLAVAPEALDRIVPGFPHWLVRGIGVLELLGVAGIILPALTRIQPRLTPWAAAGFTALMVCAAGYHLLRGETRALPFVLGLGLVSLFVAWGRFVAAPIRPRR